MKPAGRRISIALAMLLFVCAAPLHAQLNVTTYHNDNSRTGQNTQETTLTLANVNSTQFGKLFTVAVDGLVFAQPLYLSNVGISGSTHNVLYVATEHGTVYAIDADSGQIYWHKSLIPAGGFVVSAADVGCGDVATEIGITGTPVIDSTTGTLYVVAKVKVNGVIQQYLHALDVSTAAQKFNGPMLIQASVPGKASDGDGSMLTFNPKMENQRAALLLENGHVVIGWAAHCDNRPWHGWLMSYGATNLILEGAYNPSADGLANGIWMSGSGPAADSSGNIYFATGNGDWNGTTNLGDSIVKLGPPANGRFPIVDYFTPYNQAALSTNDDDVSSGGLILLPTLASGQQLLTLIGKEGRLYLVDRSNMGKNCGTQPGCTTSDPNIVQEIPKAFTGYWGAPAYWNGNLYWGG
jgi:outer membrane protein assembly factor BamB